MLLTVLLHSQCHGKPHVGGSACSGELPLALLKSWQIVRAPLLMEQMDPFLIPDLAHIVIQVRAAAGGQHGAAVIVRPDLTELALDQSSQQHSSDLAVGAPTVENPSHCSLLYDVAAI